MSDFDGLGIGPSGIKTMPKPQMLNVTKTSAQELETRVQPTIARLQTEDVRMMLQPSMTDEEKETVKSHFRTIMKAHIGLYLAYHNTNVGGANDDKCAWYFHQITAQQNAMLNSSHGAYNCDYWTLIPNDKSISDDYGGLRFLFFYDELGCEGLMYVPSNGLCDVCKAKAETLRYEGQGGATLYCNEHYRELHGSEPYVQRVETINGGLVKLGVGNTTIQGGKDALLAYARSQADQKKSDIMQDMGFGEE